MSYHKFLASPWDPQPSAFRRAFFAMHRAPEFATGEVVLSSLYRASGFDDVPESKVKGYGDMLSKAADKARKHAAKPGQIQPDTWRTVLDRLVQSPKVAQQSSKRFMSLSPLVPDVALYSGAARLQGNPWNPGELVRRIVQLGAPSDVAAAEVWERLHQALSVGVDDDVWARWLQGEFELHRQPDAEWKPSRVEPLGMFPPEDRASFAYPAKQFVADLDGIIAAKQAMTRRQWVSLLEAVLRIGTVSHVLWVCDVNHRLWTFVKEILEGGARACPSSDSDMAKEVFAVNARMLSFGHPAIPMMRDLASKYLSARLGLSCVLWALEEQGVRLESIGSLAETRAFLDVVAHKAGDLRSHGVIDHWYKLQDKEARTVACKKGIGSNMAEFAQYTLGQRQTLEQTLRGYDQGYFLRKRGDARNAPWVLALGPASVLAMAHCCLHEVRGPRSVQRMAKHMASYGVEFDMHGLNDSDLGKQLRMLGLVLDSPDAESGMLLVPPFAI